AARLSATAAAGSFAYARKTLTSAQTDLAATGDFQVQAEGPSGGNVPIFRLFDPSSTKVVSLYRQNGGAGGIWVWYDNTYNPTSASLPLNTWAQLQVHVVLTGAATGTVDVSMNGISVYHSATATVSSAGVSSVHIGNSTSSRSFTLVAHNIAVAHGAPSTPPTNTVRPSVSGTAQQGQTLTANPGTWSGTQPITYAYQWRQCTSTGASCVDIVGQMATTYVPGTADVGHAIRVFVTASNTAGSTTLGSLPTAAVQSPSSTAPVNTSPPTISGTAQEGQTLTAAPGTWTGTAPITYSYLWQRCDGAGANCASTGVTTTTYALSSADAGGTLSVVVPAAHGVPPNCLYSSALSARVPAARC